MVQKAPLKGRVVAITRPVGQAEEAGEIIRKMGGKPYYIPAIEIKPLSNPEPIKKFLAELAAGQVDFVLLMSTNGAKYLFEAAEEMGLKNQLQKGLAKAFVVAVGPRTADALKERGVHVDMVPEKYSSEGLIEELQGKPIARKKIRIPRTSNATPTLTDKLRELGADVEEIYVYESGLPVDEELKSRFYEDLNAGKIHALVFGSGLSAKNIFKMLTEKAPLEQVQKLVNSKITTVAIGPTTAEALRELGVKIDVVPQDYVFESALAALADFWAKP
jgi:uroporphyrinogen-III synthase